MKLNIPYYSQNDATEPYWKERACGIVCVKMVLDFCVPGRTPSIDRLIEEGRFIFVGGHGKHGWEHDALVMLMHNYGLHSYRQEFKSLTIDQELHVVSESPYSEGFLEEGIQKIRRTINAGFPVIVSVPGYTGQKGESHITVLTGLEEKDGKIVGFYYHQSALKTRNEGEHLFINIETFQKHWRRMAIFVEKLD